MAMFSEKNGSVEYREGSTLLDAGSTDSETQEHFVLPPLNSKRRKKKKPTVERNGCCCTCYRVLVTAGILGLLLCLGGLIYFTYTLHQQLHDLNDKISKGNAVEKAGGCNCDKYGNIASEMQKELSTHQQNIIELQKNSSLLSLQLSALNASSVALEKKVSTAPHQSPGSLSALPQQLADLGSKVGQLQTEVTTLSQFKDDTLLALAGLQSLYNNSVTLAEKGASSDNQQSKKKKVPTATLR